MVVEGTVSDDGMGTDITASLWAVGRIGLRQQ